MRKSSATTTSALGGPRDRDVEVDPDEDVLPLYVPEVF